MMTREKNKQELKVQTVKKLMREFQEEKVSFLM